MNNHITIRNSADLCRIEIEGIIGVPEEWQFENPDSRVATYEKFRQAVEQIAAVESPEVVVDIRSTGGDVNDALLIYEALKGLQAHIVTRCFGYTASAATVIAQAASEGGRQISPNALYLIHDSSCAAEGNAAELEARAEMLRKTDERLAALYAGRSGGDAATFSALMSENGGQGRWLAPQEVLEAGLADTLTDGEAIAAPAPAEPEAPAAATQSGVAAFVARNLARLKALLGGGDISADTSAALPLGYEDRNILHFDDLNTGTGAGTATGTAAPALSIAFRDAQQRAAASSVAAVEDPSMGDVRRSANELAYASDARRLATHF